MADSPLCIRTAELVTDQLETSSLDYRSYRVIKLPNQLEALLAHDAEIDKASAAMDVNVGNFSDLPEMPGLAHVLEHMLSMGTEKYPEENAYSQYLFAHSGYCNATTYNTSTSYYFHIAAKPVEGAGTSETERSPLYGALDRFSQFFISPLFLPEVVDRELHAVDSENKKNRRSDIWRLKQLDKSLSNLKHPYSHFSTGNLETLKYGPQRSGIDIQQALMKFHEDHYSANQMKLVVLGRESLDTLQEWVLDLFAGVKNKTLPQNRWEDDKPLGENELQTQIFAKPIMDTRTLKLYFPLHDEESLYKSQPSRYISHLIGHKGPGSIMSYINSNGWADGISAKAYTVCPGTPGLFKCEIQATEEGLRCYKEIVKTIFWYISLLHKTPPQEWIFKEQKGMADVKFRFKQNTSAIEFTKEISAVMQKPLPREWLLSYKKLREFDPIAIEAALACLRPDNFRLIVVSQKFPGKWDREEHWYGTEYKYEKIPADFLAEIKQAYGSHAGDRPHLHLPHKNESIPTKLEVEKKDIKNPAIAPKLIRHDSLARTWFKMDDTFGIPKANLFINCKNPLPRATAENALKARLYAKLVKDALEESAYNDELAGSKYDIFSNSMGLQIEINGYNEKILILLEKVLITMRHLLVKPNRFEIVKERLVRDMRNSELESPYKQISVFIEWLNGEKEFINDQLLAEIERLTPEDIQEFYPQLLRSMHIETLVHGNLRKEDALLVTTLVEHTLKPHPLLETQVPILRCLVFPEGSSFVYPRGLKDPKNVNHCIGYYLHVGDRADRVLRSKALLLDQMTQERAFDQLRTKEQLGYLVWSGTRVAHTTMTYRFIIQSERTPRYLEARIDTFLESCEKAMQDMSEAEFVGHKRSIITNCLQKLQNLSQESGRLWRCIRGEYFDFELVHRDATYIEKLTKSDMIQFFQHYISPSSPARAKLAIHLHAQGLSGSLSLVDDTHGRIDQSESSIIKDVREFKSRLPLSPGPRAVTDLCEFEELD